MNAVIPQLRQATYAKPTRSDMAVLMVLFNPTGAVRLVENWLYVWNKLRMAGIPVFGAELLFSWQHTASLAPEFKTITVRSDSIMFHKEKLLHRLEREVPAEFTKICCIDCDIVFGRADWYDAVSAALDERAVVQPFSACIWLGPDLRTPLAINPSAAAELPKIREAHATGTTDRLTGFPGFAVAMRRAALLPFPWAIVGGGDSVLFRGVNGLSGEFANRDMRRLIEPAWVSWSSTARAAGDMGGVSGHIWHLWHGPQSGRQYYDRYVKFVEALGPLAASCTDIRDLVVENADGVWSWREDVRKPLNTMMLRYFAGRDDDSVTIR